MRDAQKLLLKAIRGEPELKIFWEEKWITGIMLLFFGIGMGMLLLLGLIYDSMIHETENMAVTKNVSLKQCKTKFIKCFQLNGKVNNVEIFVEKFLSRLAVGPFSFDALYHLAGQAQLLSIVAAGTGICRTIARGCGMWEVIPFYLAVFVELYVYFSVSALMNLREKRRVLKVNLVDYLENHLSVRIGMTQEDLEKLHYVKPGEKMVEYMPVGERMKTVEEKERSLHRDAEKQDNTDVNESANTDDNDKMAENMEEYGDANCRDGGNTGQETWDALLNEIMTF